LSVEFKKNAIVSSALALVITQFSSRGVINIIPAADKFGHYKPANRIRQLQRAKNDKITKNGNYSANAAAITLAPIKGRLCGAKRGGDNNYSPKKGTPD
jgi:hypothetical protein